MSEAEGIADDPDWPLPSDEVLRDLEEAPAEWVPEDESELADAGSEDGSEAAQ